MVQYSFCSSTCWFRLYLGRSHRSQQPSAGAPLQQPAVSHRPPAHDPTPLVEHRFKRNAAVVHLCEREGVRAAGVSLLNAQVGVSKIRAVGIGACLSAG